MTIPPDDIAERELELVFALAGPVGSDLQEVSRTLADALRECEYSAIEEIPIGSLLRNVATRLRLGRVADAPEEERIASLMDAGNAIRRLCGNAAAAASIGIAEIRGRRARNGGVPARRAYIIRSLKRPEEVQLLRRVYGPGFFLIGVNVPRPARIESLARRIARSHQQTPASRNFTRHIAAAEALAAREEDEDHDPYGQRLRDVFQLCDLFVSSPAPFEQIHRFVRLILGDLGETPRADEHFLYQAYAASLGSGALGRHVGAVLVSPTLEVLGNGWNDVPKGGGGLYRAGEHYDRRDIHAERDSVNVHSDQMIEEILDIAKSAGWLKDDAKPQLEQARAAFRKSRVTSLIEFGRTAHAEMEAVLAAARIGASVRGATLYTTTFPCHECARLIVTAGIARVVYIEPYPKSRALELHRDAITGADDLLPPHCDKPGCQEPHAVRFEPFAGIAPHRFAELFSITTRAGIPRDRKSKVRGERILWDAKTSLPRVQLLPLSYLDLEAKVLYQLKKFIGVERDQG